VRYNTSGTHRAGLCGLPPTGRRVGVPVVSITRFTDGKWRESWTCADELGLLLQLGAPNLLLR
jgi:predicted ester cyclase